MTVLIGSILVQIASIASVFGLYFSIFPFSEMHPWWHFVGLASYVLVVLWITISEISNHMKGAPKTFKTEKGINEYMKNWVSSGGRTAIFSRDMSWARDPSTKQVLINKSRKEELILCVEKDNELILELKSNGATVIHYGNYHVPRSRFTIVDYGKEGARVAVGVGKGGVRLVREYDNGTHPFFGVAEDLVKFIQSVEAKNEIDRSRHP